MAKRVLTVAAIRAATAESRRNGRTKWLADGAMQRGAGGLQLRVEPSGVQRWYFRFTAPGGGKVRMALGVFAYDPTQDRLTLTEARAAAVEKAALYQKPESRDVRAHLEREAKRKAAEALAAEKARLAALAAEADAGKYTLEALLAVYVEHLRKQGKSSASAVENCTLNHVTKAKPEIAQRPANTITARDVAALLRPLVEVGKGRQAGKLRAYLRAAFALAARAEVDGAVPSGFLAFGVEVNPVAATGTLSEFNHALDRALSEPELRAYYAELKAAPESPSRDAMLLGLLLGGQRTAQIVRATVADVDLTARTLRLYDPKGKRPQPRAHVLPLPDAALVVVQRCIGRAEAQRAATEKAGDDVAASPGYLFSSHGGAPLRPETVTKAATDLAGTLRAKPRAERIIKDPFTLRDIRRTCETRLAGLGISRDTRAQILSHGLGGVQAKHYDRHDYLPEKTTALTAWCAYLEMKSADNVRELKRRKARQ